MNETIRPRNLGGLFLDERVDVTGETYVNACFNGCIVERRQTEVGEPPTMLWGCIFDRCQFIGDGWPSYWSKESA